MKQKISIFLFILLFPVMAFSDPLKISKATTKDTCPVCGMFVTKYPEWIASVQYKDGHTHHFDGAKDLFKYLLNMKKWAPNDKEENIKAVGVTDYYELKMIDAHNAFFVVGSDVLGPMGHELIPLVSEEDAKEFMKDHKGKKILHFGNIENKLLTKLDEGNF